MTKLADLSPSTRNKGNTSPIKTKTHIYKRKNRWGVVWSDTPVSGKRRNIIDEKLGNRIISEFNNGYSSLQLEKKYKIDNDTILRFVKSKIPKDRFDKIEKKYKIDNDTVLRFVKSKIPKDRFDKIEKKMINQYKRNNQIGMTTDKDIKDNYVGSVDEKGLPYGKGINTTYWGDKVFIISFIWSSR